MAKTASRRSSASRSASRSSTSTSTRSTAPRAAREPRGNMLDALLAREGNPPWSSGTAVITLLVSVVAMFIGVVVAGTWVGETAFFRTLGWLLGGLLIIGFVLQSRRTNADRNALRLDIPRTPFPFLLFLGVGTAILVDVISAAADRGLFLPIPELLGQSISTSVTTFVIAALFLVLVQPIAEELVFRGVLYPALGQYGGWVRWIGSSLAYAVFHLIVYIPNGAAYGTAEATVWHGLLVPFISGLIFGAVRARTGSTRAAIYFHAAFGLFAIVRALILVA